MSGLVFCYLGRLDSSSIYIPIGARHVKFIIRVAVIVVTNGKENGLKRTDVFREGHRRL